MARKFKAEQARARDWLKLAFARDIVGVSDLAGKCEAWHQKVDRWEDIADYLDTPIMVSGDEVYLHTLDMDRKREALMSEYLFLERMAGRLFVDFIDAGLTTHGEWQKRDDEVDVA